MTGTMRAAVLHAAGDVRVEEREVPSPGPGEVLVRVAVCGVCGTDATEYDRGPVLTVPPVVLGHEFAGVVEAVGEGVEGLAPGAVVVCGAGVSCGRCKRCREGRTNLCREYRTLGLQLDGGLAGHVVAPAGILLDVSDSGLSLDTLGLAQPMAIAVHVVSRSGLRAGQDAVVVGVGGIGSFITFAAAASGARVVAVDRSPDRLERARALGASDTVLAGEPLPDELGRLGVEPDVLFEVSGSPAGLEAVLAAAVPGSVIVPVGVQKTEVAVPLGSWTLRELAVVGSVAHVFATDVPEAVRLLGTRPDWSDLAAEVLPLDGLVDDALAPLLRGGARQIKTLIDPWIAAPRPAVHTRT